MLSNTFEATAVLNILPWRGILLCMLRLKRIFDHLDIHMFLLTIVASLVQSVGTIVAV
jgi:hypothetical protein